MSNVIYMDDDLIDEDPDDDVAEMFARRTVTAIAEVLGFELPADVPDSQVISCVRLREGRIAKLEQRMRDRADQIAELQRTIEHAVERLNMGDAVGALQLLRGQNGGGL